MIVKRFTSYGRLARLPSFERQQSYYYDGQQSRIYSTFYNIDHFILIRKEKNKPILAAADGMTEMVRTT